MFIRLWKCVDFGDENYSKFNLKIDNSFIVLHYFVIFTTKK